MILFKIRRPKEKVVEMDKAIVDIVRDGEVIARIYPGEENIKIESEQFKKIEANCGEEFVSKKPVVIIEF